MLSFLPPFPIEDRVMTANPTAPILLFDSGVGGLSVLGKVRQVLPEAPVMYVSDNAGLPYGS